MDLPFGGSDAASISTSRTVATQVSYSGPVPPPAMLEQYDKIMPGCAEMIMTQWRKQSDHRMSLEQTVIHSDIRRSWWGLACGFTVAMSAIVLGAFLVFNGHDVAGTILAGGGLSGLVGTFIYGTQSRKNERIEKTKMMTGKR